MRSRRWQVVPFLWRAQANGRARVGHHEVRDGYASVSDAGSGQRAPRVDPGLLGVESETHGQIGPAVRKIARKGPFSAENGVF